MEQEKIYLLETNLRTCDTNELVYKIGRSNQKNLIRLNGYPKSYKLIYSRNCVNSVDVETELLKLFNKNYTKQIGNEYFSGDQLIMVGDIEDAVNRDYAQFEEYKKNYKNADKKPRGTKKKDDIVDTPPTPPSENIKKVVKPKAIKETKSIKKEDIDLLDFKEDKVISQPTIIETTDKQKIQYILNKYPEIDFKIYKYCSDFYENQTEPTIEHEYIEFLNHNEKRLEFLNNIDALTELQNFKMKLLVDKKNGINVYKLNPYQASGKWQGKYGDLADLFY